MRTRSLFNPIRLLQAFIIIAIAVALPTAALADDHRDKSSDHQQKRDAAKHQGTVSSDKSGPSHSLSARPDGPRSTTVDRPSNWPGANSRRSSRHTDTSQSQTPRQNTDVRHSTVDRSSNWNGGNSGRSYRQTDTSPAQTPRQSSDVRHSTVDRSSNWNGGNSGRSYRQTDTSPAPRQRQNTDVRHSTVDRSSNWNGGNSGRSYRRTDTAPVQSQRRSADVRRATDFRAPTFRGGLYHYDSRRTAYHYGHWVFDGYNRTHARRSVYFFFGYFPYVDIDRVYTEPYISVEYVNGPVVFGGGYYLERHGTSALDNALSDIRDSWVDGRLDLISRHIDPDLKIAVLLDGHYDYSLAGDDYVQMTSDAIDQMRTVSFTWQKIRERADGDYTAFGKHSYIDPSGNTKTIYVSYTLGRIHGSYVITEVGSSDSPLY